jgi:hypothetical protein
MPIVARFILCASFILILMTIMAAHVEEIMDLRRRLQHNLYLLIQYVIVRHGHDD